MMRGRTNSVLAWSLAGVVLVVYAAGVVLHALAVAARDPGTWGVSSIVGEPLTLAPFLLFPAVGALISSRRPENPIGWICTTAGLLWTLIVLGENYSAYSLASPGAVPFPATVHALTYAWLWVPAVGLVGVLLDLLFPDGKLPSQRWRPVAWLAATAIVLESLAVFFTPGPLDGLPGARNPFGLEGQPWVVLVEAVVFPLLPLCMLAAAVSLVLRFRRSGGDVRQQIKWIAFAGSFVVLVYATLAGGYTLLWLVSPRPPGQLGAQSWWGPILEQVVVLSFAGIPAAIGFAVLKRRLYDIDLLINRALVYVPLTASLILIYAGAVVFSQSIFRILTGGDSSLAVVASTLVIAMVFNPLRRRIQGFIDRRFYRRKYDARETLAAFSTALRDKTDVDTLGEEMLSVVRETVQPERVFLWLKTPGGE